MIKILFCILATINISAFAQTEDFCSISRNLIEAATGNFRKYIVPGTGKYYEPSLSNRWESPFTYANDMGSKAYMSESRATKQRFFSQIVYPYTATDLVAEKISSCLASVPGEKWETKRYSGFNTWIINPRLNIEIRIIADNKGTEIQIYKARPTPPMVSSRYLIPYLLNTGEPDYILVDSATMVPVNNIAYNLEGDLYYSEDSLLTYRAYNPDTEELGYGFLKTNGNSDITYLIATEGGSGIRFVEGMAWIKKYGLWYFIDKKGNQIIRPSYQELNPEYFIEGMCAVKLFGKWGYVDKSGKVAIPLIYENASFFYKGYAEIKKNNKWGIINKAGKEIIIPAYDSILHGIESGFYKIQKNGYWGFLNKEGKEIVSPEYESIPGIFQGNLCAVQKNKKWGAIDTTGKIVIPLKYSEPFYVFNEMAIFSQNKLFGLLDKTGKQIILPKYQAMMEITEGLGAVQRNGKWGFIDKTGKEVIPVKYENVLSSFKDGLASVILKNKVGLIDKTGKTVIPFVYDNIFSFEEGLAQVYQNGKSGYIDKTGKVIIPLIYNWAQAFKYGKALVRNEDDILFFIDKAGREYREK